MNNNKSFKEVNARQSFPEMEQAMLKFWEEESIFEESVARRKQEKKFVFFDGPPFANGLPHYGHILANALKDAVTRYWTMKGYYVPRTNGWDCHGLPVEYEIEKELEISGRKDIEKFGIENFNEKCRESVFKYTNEWEKMLGRIGRWLNHEETYATLQTNYMESIWWVFKQIWDKDLVYQGHKSMHICPRCETPLSNFEVTQGYKDVTDQAVTLKFQTLEDPKTFLLAWTTTPWCLPGQIALTVHPDKKYLKVKAGDENYWLVEARVEAIMRDIEYEVIEEKKGSELVGTSYKPLFDYCSDKKNDAPNSFTVIADEYVTDEDGSGFVTTSPDFGEDDMRVCQDNDIPFTETVDGAGVYRDVVKDWAGMSVLKANPKVLNHLVEEGKTLWHENYRHSYPHCWRCDTPLLNYTTKAWFIEVTKIKDKLLANNKKIHWQPEHIKDGRFGKWLEGARDWNISRSRFWGCPIPIWECECGEHKAIGSVEELKEHSIGGKQPERHGELDLHIPYIDDIKFKCDKCDKEMSRIPEVLDCWFESGSMPYAQLHYPFENKKLFEENFPAQFIAEGLDQTRGWFYTLHVLSTILFDKPAFENVIVNGILLAADGEKLSKRKKNYPDPTMLFDTRGVDAMRFFLYSSTAPLAEDVRFSEKHVDELIKKFLLTLWNTYSFFVTYANIDEFDPNSVKPDFKPKNKLDQWLLSELNQLIKETTKELDNYNLTKGTRPMMDFVDNLSNWYVRRSRRRFWKSESDTDKTEAYTTLYIVLTEFSKVIAPFMPFVADEIYRNLTSNLKDGEGSVHLCDWPKPNEDLINEDLNNEMAIIRRIVNLGHGVRAKAQIKVRQPLGKVQVGLPDSVDSKIVETQKDVILEELNCKELEVLTEVGDVVQKVVKPDARKLGPKFGKDVQQIIQKVKAGDYDELDGGGIKVGEFELDPEEFEIGFEGKEGLDVQGEDGFVVILDTNITDDLRHEGYAREVVRFVQELRKQAGYEVYERIYLQVKASNDVEKAVTQFADYIKRETLSIELQQGSEFTWDKEEEVEINGEKVVIGVRKED